MRPFASTSPGCFRLAYERAFRQGRPRRPALLTRRLGPIISRKRSESAVFSKRARLSLCHRSSNSFLNQVGPQPEVERRILVTAAKPLARYGAIEERAREQYFSLPPSYTLWRRGPADLLGLIHCPEALWVAMGGYVNYLMP